MRKQTKIAAMVSAAALLAIGASMTSFANWNLLDDGVSYEYLNRDGSRVENEWRKSNGKWFYLGDDGIMLTNQLVPSDDDDDLFYVGSDGARVTNQWVELPNEDEEVIGDEDIEVDTLWYYFGATGKAYKSDESDNPVKKTVAWSGGTDTFFFDEDGHMLCGWIDYRGSDDKVNYYYLGDETQGYAAAKGKNGNTTGWLLLEPASWMDPAETGEEDYEDEEYFYFGSNGKANKADDGDGKVSKYVDGLYFTFDENGVLVDEWFNTATFAGVTASGSSAFTGTDGVKTGWVYATTADDEDSKAWYYMVNVDDDKAIAFGSGAEKAYTAKSINGNTYLFNNAGKVQTGIKEIKADQSNLNIAWDGQTVKTLNGGYYYFSDATAPSGLGKDGKMLTGKQSYTNSEDETFNYYFRKSDETVLNKSYSKGSAYTSWLKDGSLYDVEGKRVDAEDGNSYEVITISTNKRLKDDDGNGNTVPVHVGDETYKKGQIIVSSSGKAKKNGTITIDDATYVVDNYFVIDKYQKGDKEAKLSYEKAGN